MDNVVRFPAAPEWATGVDPKMLDRGMVENLKRPISIPAPSAIRRFFLRAAVNFFRNPASACGREGQVFVCNEIWRPMSMAENSALNPEPPRRRCGRPSKAEELQRALAALAIDPRTVDPLAVLAGIMVNPNLPAAARVQAARLLIAARDQAQAKPKLPVKNKAEARPSKKAAAARAAATAGGVGSGWGDDLAWPDGRRPQ
jgi:hypothetical protein